MKDCKTRDISQYDEWCDTHNQDASLCHLPIDLDERIGAYMDIVVANCCPACISGQQPHGSVHRKDVRVRAKQLIRDVLEYVKPERKADSEVWASGFNASTSEMEAKIKELGL